MNNYKLYQSETILKKYHEVVDDLEVVKRLVNEMFPGQDTTWAYGMYNVFALTAPSTTFYDIFNEVRKLVRDELGYDRPLWIQAWLNYHTQDQLLKWHDHCFDYHGYISIDPKNTKTVFEEYEIVNKPGQIYFGLGNKFHRVEAVEPFDGVRTTIGFDIHTIPNNPLVERYDEKPFKNMGMIPLP